MSKEKETSVNIDRTKYSATRSASGSKSLSNGDEVASTLEGLTIEGLFAIGDTLLGEDFRKRYADLNAGMQRMNMGNRIRNKVKQIDDEDNAKVGIDALVKAAKPYIKERDANIKAVAKEKEDAAKALTAKKAAAEKEKAAKKATREKETAARKVAKEKEKAAKVKAKVSKKKSAKKAA